MSEVVSQELLPPIGSASVRIRQLIKKSQCKKHAFLAMGKTGVWAYSIQLYTVTSHKETYHQHTTSKMLLLPFSPDLQLVNYCIIWALLALKYVFSCSTFCLGVQNNSNLLPHWRCFLRCVLKRSNGIISPNYKPSSNPLSLRSSQYLFSLSLELQTAASCTQNTDSSSEWKIMNMQPTKEKGDCHLQ